MQAEATGDRLTDEDLSEVEMLATRYITVEPFVAGAVPSSFALRALHLGRRMAHELRRLYERERVLRVEAEKLRAELVRTRAETTIDEGEAG